MWLFDPSIDSTRHRRPGGAQPIRGSPPMPAPCTGVYVVWLLAGLVSGAGWGWWSSAERLHVPLSPPALVYAVFRGIPLVAKCLYKGEPDALPPPCSEILAF